MAKQSEIVLPSGSVQVQRGGRGAPLLFLHGAQGLNGWEPALVALSEQFDVIAPDHPGYGRSAVIDGIDDMADLALLYLDFLGKLGFAKVHVVGHCIGGWLALEMAARNTCKMGSLTIVASAGLRLPNIPRADMFICSQDELARLLLADSGAAETWVKSWHTSPEQEDIYDRNRFASAKYAWQPRLCNPKLSQWLHRIEVPTHIIWGDDDRVLPCAYADALKDSIKDATMTLLPGCGHLPHVERPAEFTAAVTKFIRSMAS